MIAMIAMIVVGLSGCIHLPERVSAPQRIDIEAFSIWIVPKLHHRGVWHEKTRIMFIEGDSLDGNLILSDKVLLHEIKHVLRSADKRFKNPDVYGWSLRGKRILGSGMQ